MLYVLRANESHGILFPFFLYLKIAQGCEGVEKLTHQLYVSGLSSAFAQHGAKFQVNVRLTFCERSATQKCINLPSSFFRWPGSARRIVDGQTMKFLPPRSTIRPPLPIGLSGGPVAHHVANFIDQVRPRTQANMATRDLDGTTIRRPIDTPHLQYFNLDPYQ